MTRKQAYKEHPEIAAMTDFLTQHETKLRILHSKHCDECRNNMEFLAFVDYIYHNAQDLVLNPEDN